VRVRPRGTRHKLGGRTPLTWACGEPSEMVKWAANTTSSSTVQDKSIGHRRAHVTVFQRFPAPVRLEVLGTDCHRSRRGQGIRGPHPLQEF
jgi:hypothetical protein